MKLYSTLCMFWLLLHTVHSVSLEDKLKELEKVVIEEVAMKIPEMSDAELEMLFLEESVLEEAIEEEEYLEELEMGVFVEPVSRNEAECGKANRKCTKMNGTCKNSCNDYEKEIPKGCIGKGCTCCVVRNDKGPIIQSPAGLQSVCDGKAKWSCKKHGGSCVTEPFQYNCNALHGSSGKLKKQACKSKDCQCCLPPPTCAGKIKKSCSKHGGSCVLKPFKANCADGILDKSSCRSPHCMCCIPVTVAEENTTNIFTRSRLDSCYGPNGCDDRNQAIGKHDYCGPYTMHYSNRQCDEVGLHYGYDTHFGITVLECEAKCDDHFSCNAINWSHKKGLGCVLRDCGPEAIPNPFPMPMGWNKDFYSFSRYKPDEIPRCHKHTGGTYDTPNKYCGPYARHYEHGKKRCSKIGTISDVIVLECEQHCDAKLECTAYNYKWKNGLRCDLITCRGDSQPKPGGEHADIISFTKDQLPGVSLCILDGRDVKK